jgi:DNA-binding winged helix-turn-helix (wHTH) protein
LVSGSPEAVAHALGGFGSCDALAAPMPPLHRPVGIIAVGRSRGVSFAYSDQAFLNALAAVAALGLERFRLENDHQHTRRQDLLFTGSNAEVGDLRIDLEDQEVVFEGRRARLTRSELRILLFLAAQPGHARTRREILRHLWHSEYVGDERACDAHISNLRRKIERDPSRPNRVVTVRGVGYALYLPRHGA